jgi:hypothetical protein
VLSNSNILFRRFSRLAKLILAAVILASAAIGPAFAQSEAGVKTAFIYNFAKFTEWPASAFAGDSAPITVGFVGADSLADTFEKNVTGKNANGRDFAVKKLSGAAGVDGCQIVFVGDASQASAVIGALKGKPVLQVGDSAGFAAAGGMITFVVTDGKVSFDLDLGAINAGGLKLNDKLRQVARNVKGG